MPTGRQLGPSIGGGRLPGSTGVAGRVDAPVFPALSHRAVAECSRCPRIRAGSARLVNVARVATRARSTRCARPRRRSGRAAGRATCAGHRGPWRRTGRAADVLDARGVAVPDDVRARVSACTDLDQLETCIRHAATAGPTRRSPGNLGEFGVGSGGTGFGHDSSHAVIGRTRWRPASWALPSELCEATLHRRADRIFPSGRSRSIHRPTPPSPSGVGHRRRRYS